MEVDKQEQKNEMLKTCPHYDDGRCWYEATHVTKCNGECEFGCAVDIFTKAGYREEKEVVKEVLLKVQNYTLDDEVGMRYLLRKTAKEYGVELNGKSKGEDGKA